MQDCLDPYRMVEEIDWKKMEEMASFTCDRCKQEGYSRKTEPFITGHPKFLFLGLTRMRSNEERTRTWKVMTKILASERIRHGPHSNPRNYDLNGVVFHIGESMSARFYVAIVQDDRGVCVEVNDEKTTTLGSGPIEALLPDYLKAKGSTVYLLLYERVDQDVPLGTRALVWLDRLRAAGKTQLQDMNGDLTELGNEARERVLRNDD